MKARKALLRRVARSGVARFKITVGTRRGGHLFKWASGLTEIKTPFEDFRCIGTPAHNVVSTNLGHTGAAFEYAVPH